jgi:hypothetical protein
MEVRSVWRCIYVAVALGGLVPGTAIGQQEQCLQLAQSGVQSTTWQEIRAYFASLSLGDETRKERSRLLQLRAQIIDLESQKQQLIEIVSSHLNGGTSGVGVGSKLMLTDIPSVLTQIDRISERLADIARTGDLFAAEKAFKDLKVNLDEKRASTLCQLAQEAVSANPDRSKMANLIESLKTELKAISDAEEALGDYIKKISK